MCDCSLIGCKRVSAGTLETRGLRAWPATIQVVSDAGLYDAKCLACHSSKSNTKANVAHSAPACRVGTKNCVSCHMEKIEVPGTYATFTDHWIRVVKKGAQYPE